MPYKQPRNIDQETSKEYLVSDEKSDGNYECKIKKNLIKEKTNISKDFLFDSHKESNQKGQENNSKNVYGKKYFPKESITDLLANKDPHNRQRLETQNDSDMNLSNFLGIIKKIRKPRKQIQSKPKRKYIRKKAKEDDKQINKEKNKGQLKIVETRSDIGTSNSQDQISNKSITNQKLEKFKKETVIIENETKINEKIENMNEPNHFPLENKQLPNNISIVSKNMQYTPEMEFNRLNSSIKNMPSNDKNVQSPCKFLSQHLTNSNDLKFEPVRKTNSSQTGKIRNTTQIKEKNRMDKDKIDPLEKNTTIKRVKYSQPDGRESEMKNTNSLSHFNYNHSTITQHVAAHPKCKKELHDSDKKYNQEHSYNRKKKVSKDNHFNTNDDLISQVISTYQRNKTPVTKNIEDQTLSTTNEDNPTFPDHYKTILNSLLKELAFELAIREDIPLKKSIPNSNNTKCPKCQKYWAVKRFSYHVEKCLKK